MNLFDTSEFEPTTLSDEGCYFPTPAWAAQQILEERVPLGPNSFVLEPTCGDGRWLDVLPAGVKSLGVELREDLAAIARGKGHQVICGDILNVELPEGITHAIGNPPFVAEFCDKLMLDVLHKALPHDGLAAFVLPTYYFQTSRHVWDLHRKWSIDVELIPRDLYFGLRYALCLARFTKSTTRRLAGFFLYPETVGIGNMSERARKRLTEGSWRAAVRGALEDLGGKGSLQQIYRQMEPRRPTTNPNWEAQTRKVLYTYPEFTQLGPALHGLAQAA